MAYKKKNNTVKSTCPRLNFCDHCGFGCGFQQLKEQAENTYFPYHDYRY